jgi:methyl-accepting chemotaxis protein
MRVNQLVTLGFGVVFVLMGINTATSHWSRNSSVEAAKRVEHTYQVKAELNSLEKALIDAETGQRGFLLTNEIEFLEPYNQGRIKLQIVLANLTNEIKDNPSQIKNLEEIAKLSQNKLEDLQRTILLKQLGKEPELKKILLAKTGKQLMDKIRLKIAEMILVESKLLSERQKVETQIQQTATVVSWGGTTIAIVFGIFIAWIVSRIIMRPINEAVLAISSSAHEIAIALEEQERIASEQANFVNQTSSTMTELNASAFQAAQQAEASNVSARNVAQLVMHLSEQTRKIGSITETVTDLASQTNMLALNAAVEAVHAGDKGKGFSIVAAEIRRLADESKKSAKNINTLIIDIQKLTDSAVTISGETKNLESIVVAVNNIVLNSQQISLTAKQQALAIQEVVSAMNAINTGIAETARGINQTKIGTQELSLAAQRLKTLGVG